MKLIYHTATFIETRRLFDGFCIVGVLVELGLVLCPAPIFRSFIMKIRTIVWNDILNAVTAADFVKERA